MPYKKGKARKAFELEIDSFINELRGVNLLPHAAHRDLILCATVLLCSARIEVYFSELIGDWIQKINFPSGGKIVRNKNVPYRLRAFIFLSSHKQDFENHVIHRDEKKLLEKLVQSPGPLDQFDSKQICQRIYAGKIYSDRKYPSTKNIEILFGRIGLTKIFDKIKVVAKQDLKPKIQSFNDIRTELAHNGAMPGKNANDISLILKDIKYIVGVLDKVTHKHIVDEMGGKYWSV